MLHSYISSLISFFTKSLILSFRASEARHGIQYFQYVLDAGFRNLKVTSRHDGVDGTFYYYDTVSFAGMTNSGVSKKSHYIFSHNHYSLVFNTSTRSR